MTEKDRLDKIFTTHLQPLVIQQNWTRIDVYEDGRGACLDYKSGTLYVRISNDRGIIEIELGSSADDLRNVSFYKDLLAPPMGGRWNLSAEQACLFILEQWSWFQKYLSPENAFDTVRRVDAVGS